MDGSLLDIILASFMAFLISFIINGAVIDKARKNNHLQIVELLSHLNQNDFFDLNFRIWNLMNKNPS
mgnify:CR=1 FL=1